MQTHSAEQQEQLMSLQWESACHMNFPGGTELRNGRCSQSGDNSGPVSLETVPHKSNREQ